MKLPGKPGQVQDSLQMPACSSLATGSNGHAASTFLSLQARLGKCVSQYTECTSGQWYMGIARKNSPKPGSNSLAQARPAKCGHELQHMAQACRPP